MRAAPSTPESTAPPPRSEGTRIDTFVDGAFAFAITLLVISGGNLPSDVAGLEHALRGIPAFAACFSQLALFWYGHVRWRDSLRRVDGRSLLLSLLLVFFALIFVFPLHLVYASLFNGISNGVLSPDFTYSGADLPGMAGLFICYGLSYTCMAGTLALLFRHGRRAAARTGADIVEARVSQAAWTYFAAIGLASCLIALVALVTGTDFLIAIAGFTYALLGFTGVVTNRARRRLVAIPTP